MVPRGVGAGVLARSPGQKSQAYEAAGVVLVMASSSFEQAVAGTDAEKVGHCAAALTDNPSNAVDRKPVHWLQEDLNFTSTDELIGFS